MFRIGSGFDVHPLVTERNLILGGVRIPFEKGLLGHSDADVLAHAIMDGLLGALALGDIGIHFPDTDSRYKNADSMEMLKRVYQKIVQQQYTLVNLDCTIMAQRPRIMPYMTAIQNNIASVLNAEVSQISIKATTTEKLGFVGREEGIAAQAVVLLQKINFTLNGG
ncbi:MAG: 2-C-methyl-D-erythritol 2,4-cyclodiphosphate synthase [SAR324 cluster bacterium]|nr:2-C-methyl-D-erythritol 2,4-cyclodiphosphate synthase [SAR324 cluster bacterium]